MTMIIALLLLAQDTGLAKAATPPKPAGSPSNWVTDDDYPSGPLAREEFGTVRFGLGIDTTGKVVSCHVLATSGFAELDQTACAALIRRARFSPARDATGTAINANYFGSFSWLLPGGPTIARIAREPVPTLAIDLTLNKVPVGYRQPALLRVHFTSASKPDACKVELGSGVDALDKIACQQAMEQAVPPAETLKWNRKPDTAMVTVSFAAQ